MYFKVGNDTAGNASWWLYGDNHRLAAWAGETFSSHYSAERAAAAFKAGAETARYDIYVDAGGQWRWRAWRSSDNVAASGESFSSRSSAQSAADNVRDNAGNARL